MEHKIDCKVENYYFHRATDRRYSESTQHYHSHYEIYYMKSGTCRYFIDDRAYDVKAGDLIFIPCNIIHRTNYTSDTHSRALINFTAEHIPPDLAERLGGLKYLYRSVEISRAVEHILQKIEQEYKCPDMLAKSALSCYTTEILLLLLRSPRGEEDATTGNELVDSVVKYIKNSYTGEIKLLSVAKMKSVSPEHLSRTFKSATGLGFNEYVTLLRLRRAEEMIKNEHHMSISEIAYECGFNDGNYFSYKFKKIYGIPPNKMRENY